MRPYRQYVQSLSNVSRVQQSAIAAAMEAQSSDGIIVAQAPRGFQKGHCLRYGVVNPGTESNTSKAPISVEKTIASKTKAHLLTQHY